jgi:hypothetical protein
MKIILIVMIRGLFVSKATVLPATAGHGTLLSRRAGKSLNDSVSFDPR